MASESREEKNRENCEIIAERERALIGGSKKGRHGETDTSVQARKTWKAIHIARSGRDGTCACVDENECDKSIDNGDEFWRPSERASPPPSPLARPCPSP